MDNLLASIRLSFITSYLDSRGGFRTQLSIKDGALCESVYEAVLWKKLTAESHKLFSRKAPP